MASVTMIRDFHVPHALAASYQRLIDGFNAGIFGPAVRQALRDHTHGMRRLYLYEARGTEDSRLRYSDCEPSVTALFPLYEGHYRRFDPICEAYRAAPRVGDVVMQRVCPSDIVSADFRHRFFDKTGIIERISIVQRGHTGWRAINLARHKSDGYFSETELTNIVGLAGLVLPMLTLDGRPTNGTAPPDIRQLEARFEALFPELPLRERQVCSRAARGMSIEATALDLGVGKASVLTYRRRAYGRLRVSSPVELRSLVTH